MGVFIPFYTVRRPLLPPRNDWEKFIYITVQDFTRDIYFYGLGPFFERIQFVNFGYNYNWSKVKVYLKAIFSVFSKLLRHMESHEKEFHFEDLSDLYTFLFTRNIPDLTLMHEMDYIFYLLLDILQESSKSCRTLRCANFLRKCEEVSKQNLYTILKKVDHSGLNFILLSLSAERDWDFGKSSDLLMNVLSTASCDFDNASLLAYNRFPYSYNRKYFLNNVQILQSPLFKVLGRDFKDGFHWSMLYTYSSRTYSKRLQMAIELLIGIFYNQNPKRRIHQEDKKILMNFLRVLWISVPHPLISQTEMYRILRPFYCSKNVELSVLCNEYAKHNTIFPVDKDSKPRSLMHLARVKVRTTLFKANTIGDKVIDSLDIPPSIKSYLKLNSSIEA